MTIQLFIFIFTAFIFEPVSTVMDAEEVILDKAEEAIKQQVESHDIRFQLSARWIPGSVRRLDGSEIISVVPVGELKKFTSFKVTFSNSGGRKNAEIQLQVQAEQRIPVLIERKLRGDKIREQDVEWRWISIDLNRDKPVTDLNEIKGKTLRRSLLAGQYISSDHIGGLFLINAGDEVKMFYEQHGLQIILSCESRQDGAVEEEIQIYCKETRKKYLARITGPGEAQWLKTH